MSLLETLLQNHQSPLDRLMSIMPLLNATQDTGSVFDTNDVNTSSGVLQPGDPSLVTRHGVTLTRPAMRSLLDVARESSVLPGTREFQYITDSYRTPAQQAAAYAAKPGIAAAPGTSYHQRGLAVDAGWWTEHGLASLLEQAGWNRFSPTGEPWHWSYGVTG